MADSDDQADKDTDFGQNPEYTYDPKTGREVLTAMLELPALDRDAVRFLAHLRTENKHPGERGWPDNMHSDRYTEDYTAEVKAILNPPNDDQPGIAQAVRSFRNSTAFDSSRYGHDGSMSRADDRTAFER